LAKPEWGVKRNCQSCGTRFYDMTRTPIICPKCSAVVEPEVTFKARRQSVSESKAGKVAVVVVPEVVVEIDPDAEVVVEDADAEVDPLAEADEDETSLMEDTSDLGEDDDDMAEVMEHIDEDLEGES
jgi:uncharacterized protein (TIGR02300 family)